MPSTGDLSRGLLALSVGRNDGGFTRKRLEDGFFFIDESWGWLFFIVIGGTPK